MTTWRSYLDLFVPEYIPMGLTAVLAGVASTAHFLPLDQNFFLSMASTVFLLAGYNAFNAIADERIDLINKPERPLPRGLVNPKTALVLSAAAFALAIATALLINTAFLSIILVSSLIAIAYSFPGIHLKRRFALNTLSAAALYVLLLPLAGWALYPQNQIPLNIITFLFFFGVGTAVLKDFEDVPGDSKYGANTMPVSLGYKEATIFSTSSYFLSLLLLVFLVLQQSLTLNYLFLTLFPIFSIVNVVNLYKNHSPFLAKTTFKVGIVLLIFLELTVSLLGLV